MKTINLIIAAFMAIGLSACGNQNNPYAANGYNNGYGYPYGTQTGYGNYPGGCAPIQSGSFGFSAQGAQMNGAIILAGTLPANSTRPGTYGQVTLGAPMQPGYGMGMIQYQPKVGQAGQLQISVSPQNGMLSGSIQLSPAIVYQLMSMTGGYNPYNPMMPQQGVQNQICVQSLALDIVHTTNMPYGGSYYPQQPMAGMGQINQALVYMTLSTGQTIGPFVF